MSTLINRVNLAMNDLKQGKMIILTDSNDRENEGDLVAAAETITPEQMNFMIRHGSGIVCLPMSAEYLQKIGLSIIVPEDDTESLQAPFTMSIDANRDITTGVSAADRVKTIQLAIHDQAQKSDFTKPGHVFPLMAKAGGVLERQGHTEGSVDLAVLAGLKPAAVICEVMNPDGTMSRGEQLETFAREHELTTLSIDDLITYRLMHENMISEEASTTIPIENYGTFKVTVVKEKYRDNEHLVLTNTYIDPKSPLLVRIHSSCMTGDLFASKRCDCNKQFHHALQRISQEGGMMIYLNQEGRGIGLFNKIRAYALQEQGLDTVEANLELGLPIDSRNYSMAANILRNHKVNHVRLLTNNPSKINDLKKYGIAQVERAIMPSFSNEHNQCYLKTKNAKLQHCINLDGIHELQKVPV